MAPKETQTEKSFPFNLAPMEFAVMGKKQIEAFTGVQSELFEKFEADAARVARPRSIGSEYGFRICIEAVGGSFDPRSDDGL